MQSLISNSRSAVYFMQKKGGNLKENPKEVIKN